MILKINEDIKNNIKREAGGKNIIVNVRDFSLLLDRAFSYKMAVSIIKEDQTVKYLNLPEDVIKTLINYVINNRDENDVKEYLTRKGIILYSLIIQAFIICKRKYNIASEMMSIDNNEIDKLEIYTSKENFRNAITLAKKYNIQTTIYCVLPLTEYRSILSNLDLEELDKLNINVYYQSSNEPISLSKLYKTSLLVSEIANKIEKCHLSPSEQIMTVYDIVKTRKYKKSSKDNPGKSRYLDEVLLGDAIVCVGYVNIFNAILKCLGFNPIDLTSIKAKHQRSICYVKDEKYDIDNVFVFDPTFDSKRNDGDVNYLGRYHYFAISLEESNKDAPEELFKTILYSIDQLVRIINNNTEVIKKIDLLYNLETLFDIVGDQNFDTFKEGLFIYKYLSDTQKAEIIKIYSRVQSKYFKSEINPEVFMTILYNTRRIQYYNGITTNLFIDDIINTTVEKYIRIISNKQANSKSSQHKTFSILLNYANLLDRLESCFTESNSKLGTKEEIEKDRERISLTRILRRKLENESEKMN